MKSSFTKVRLLAVVCGLILACNNFVAAKNDAPAPVRYTVAMSKPATHLLEVEMRVSQNRKSATLEIQMPVWTPGSYLIREYARHVQDFAAKTADGQNLKWEKINKNTWRIQSNGAREIAVNYKVYANELTVRTNELNDEHAFWNNAATLMFPKNDLKRASIVRVVPFGNWKIATGLPNLSDDANAFAAENYDVLYDSPFEVGNFTEIKFDVRSVPHRIVIEGEGNYDVERLRADVPRIVDEAAKIFGELPYKNYTFIVNLRGGGGLEHLNSTALQTNRFAFAGGRYLGFLGLVAHEFFHAWNVKRIRPDALGPFDYLNENYTKNLWIAEGGTEFYSNVILRRAGFSTDKSYLTDRADGIERLQRQPGRLAQSLEESSFDAWIKYYRPDENSINREISYYDKGELVNMLLDLRIRQQTGGAKSLDDVMRVLYNDFYKRNKNYTPQDFQKTAETIAGVSLNDFFAKYVRGRDEIDWNAAFAPFGLRLETRRPNAKPEAFLGANFAPTANALTVSNVPAATPAYEQGLNANDQILAIDNYKITTQAELNQRLADHKSGDKVKLTFYRFDRLRELEITLGERTPENYRFVALENVTDAQKRLYQNWLGAELR